MRIHPARHRRPRPRRRTRLRIEPLEPRQVLSASASFLSALTLVEQEANDTVQPAQLFGAVTQGQTIGVAGQVGNGVAGDADVDFYSFTLAQLTRIRLEAQPLESPGSLAPVLGLYNEDPMDPVGYRLLDQVEGSSQAGAALERTLGPGTYYVAMSGLGNRYFHPLIAGSGLAGSTGAYGLVVTASPPLVGLGTGPAVIATDPQPGAQLDLAPLVIRIAFSEALDQGTILEGATVRLVSSLDNQFSADDVDVPFPLFLTFDDATNELSIAPAAALAPGHYFVVLAGDTIAHSSLVLRSLSSGAPLGQITGTDPGQDYVLPFAVTGAEGVQGANSADDTIPTAHELGGVLDQFVQKVGAIGDDPTDSFSNPSDVDLYHFRIDTPDQVAFVAEVFAGRIGSALDPALTLFQKVGGQLVFVASNGGTGNPTSLGPWLTPLSTDAALILTLSEGDYYLAVSSGINYVSPDEGLLPGDSNGVFLPGVSHSGSAGNSRGLYVLNLKAERSLRAPHVVDTSVADGELLIGSPERLTVRFDAPVNLPQLAVTSFTQGGSSRLSSVFIRSSTGAIYSPRLESFDFATRQATFLMIEALPDGDYELHLSGQGPGGVTDLAGNPLAGNDPSGDFVIRFRVELSGRPPGGGPLVLLSGGARDSQQPAVLGTLFPAELKDKVTVRRGPSAGDSGPGDNADYFQFRVLQEQDYVISVTPEAGMTTSPFPVLVVGTDTYVGIPQPDGSFEITAHLFPGTYTVQVDWGGAPGSVDYRLELLLVGNPEQAPPLTSGPAPILRLRLGSDALPTPPVLPVGPTPGGTPVVPVSGPGTDGGAFIPVDTGGSLNPFPVGDVFRALGAWALGGEEFGAGAESFRSPRLDLPGTPLLPPGLLVAFTLPVGGGLETEEASGGEELLGTDAAFDWGGLAHLLAGRGLTQSATAVTDGLQIVGRIVDQWSRLPAVSGPAGDVLAGGSAPARPAEAAPVAVTDDQRSNKAEEAPATTALPYFGWMTAAALGCLFGVMRWARWRALRRQESEILEWPAEPVIRHSAEAPPAGA